MDNRYVLWLRVALWLGLLMDWGLSLPAVFAPQWLLALLGGRVSADPVWTAFAAQLLFLVSLFFIPGALRPRRHRFSAGFAVLARLPVAGFFLLLHPAQYPLLGILHGVLFVVQLPLLLLAMGGHPGSTDTLPTTAPREHAARWLGRSLWLGIIVNGLLAVPAVLFPVQVLALLGLRPSSDPLWTAAAALALVFLSIGYVPGAHRPRQYRYNAWLAVFARVPGVWFFLVLWTGFYPLFGVLDGVLFLLQITFLIRAMR